ncbi:MAG TPA: hypothetical protein VHB48_06365 [Chitinophagaceae bacterium]|nr:hypothetical protein [Chitinophagaceae bacterium]
MKKIYLLITLLLLSVSCIAQFNINNVVPADIPLGIKVPGNITKTVKWKDSLGNNLVIVAETGVIVDNNDLKSASLHAYHYIIKNDSVQLLWKVYDFIDSCDVDIKVEFVNNTFAVTDLNHNGIAEVWLMYKVSCQGDVSPIPMKIIMYEGIQKFAARGGTIAKVSLSRYDGGDYIFDDAFKNGPDAFRQYANALWQKHKMEQWGE